MGHGCILIRVGDKMLPPKIDLSLPDQDVRKLYVELDSWRDLAEAREEVICRQGKEIKKLRKKVERLNRKLKETERVIKFLPSSNPWDR